MADCLLVSEPDEGVVWLTLNRPAKRNALSVELRDAVSDALDSLAGNNEVRVVIVAAAGDTFCAGFDLDEFGVEEPGFQERLWRSSDRFHQRVMRFPLPTIAAVRGPAMAGGFDLAVLCDLRIADSTARFAHPEQSWSDVVFSPLADLLGSAGARDLCFTGRNIDAAHALSIGLVSAVVEPDDLSPETSRMAAMIARAPRDSLLRGKAKAIRRSLRIDPCHCHPDPWVPVNITATVPEVLVEGEEIAWDGCLRLGRGFSFSEPVRGFA